MYKDVEPKTIQLYIRIPENPVGEIDNRIRVLKTFDEIQTQLIEIPRYKEFLELIPRIVNNNIEILQIAGQTQIQCKIKYKNSFGDFSTGAKLEYEWSLPTQPDYIYGVVTVDVVHMKNFLSHLKKNFIELLYIHDF